jgi:hypothetical protein
MEKNFYHTDFEEYLKEKADQYKMYPSDKVWKGIDRSMRSYRKWYWTGFILLLSGISYFAVTELMSPSTSHSANKIQTPPPPKPTATAALVDPFNDIAPGATYKQTVTSDIIMEDSGALTASFEIPLQLFDIATLTGAKPEKASLLITGLAPLNKYEEYNIELSWPVFDENAFQTPAEHIDSRNVDLSAPDKESQKINWLQDQAGLRLAPQKIKRISWQLAFSPTVNYRKLNSSSNFKTNAQPMTPNIDRDVNNVVNHRPALGFELGTHAFLSLGKRLTLKGGLQFNYSKYDIDAFRSSAQSATIALNASLDGGPRMLTSYTDINNFAGRSAESLKNQYFQLSVPVGLEFRVFGNDRVQFNIASTIQPTYLLNRNTYLITTDYRNYTKEPSLVRRWNVNAGAEAFVSYTRGGVKWQVGPQFRYQLLSSYENVYPIKEYLMEYGIKVGITKTIR